MENPHIRLRFLRAVRHWDSETALVSTELGVATLGNRHAALFIFGAAPGAHRRRWQLQFNYKWLTLSRASWVQTTRRSHIQSLERVTAPRSINP